MTALQNKTCSELARHFNLKARDVRQEVLDYLKSQDIDEQDDLSASHPVLKINLPDVTLELGFTQTAVPKLPLRFKDFEKHEAYADILTLLEDAVVDAVVFLHKSEPYVIHEREDYNGLAGIVFKKSLRHKMVYVVESFRNYLQRKYGVEYDE